jgi:hypothetical protein
MMIQRFQVAVFCLAVFLQWHYVAARISLANGFRSAQSRSAKVGPPGLGLDDVLAAADGGVDANAAALATAVQRKPPKQQGAAALQRSSSKVAAHHVQQQRHQQNADRGTHGAASAHVARTAMPVLDEYDVAEEDDHNGKDDMPLSDTTEQATMEGARRQATGDVTPIAATKKASRISHGIVHRSGRRLALQRRLTGSVNVASQRASGALLAQERMRTQCLQFADFVSQQGVRGLKFVNLWKSTCQPALDAGAATPVYRDMCAAIGGAIEPFSNVANPNPEQVCTAVVNIMKNSGVGSSPVLP